MPTVLRINLLGPCECLVEGRHIALGAAHYFLLALFLVRDTSTIARSELAALLWPDASSTRARHSLSQTIYSINHSLPFKVFEGNRTDIRFLGGSSDVIEFRNAIEAGEWESAAELYRGEFCQGQPTKEHSALSDWLLSCRHYFGSLALQVAEQLQVDGKHRSVGPLLSRLPGFLDLNVDQDALSGTEAAAVHPTQGDNSFVGRRREIDWLHVLQEKSFTGFTAALIQGEPGLGKTALLTRFARVRAIRGSRVLTAQGFQAEQNVPFGVVAQWLRFIRSDEAASLPDPWALILENAFPGTVRSNVDQRQSIDSPSGFGEFRLLEALRRLFVACTDGNHLLLVLDDAELADAASLGFVHYLSRRDENVPILFLAAVSSSGHYQQGIFSGWDNLNPLVLEPFCFGDVEALIKKTHAGHSLTQEELQDLLDRTGGNPLVLTSLLKEGEGGSSDIPDSIVDFFRPRFDRLSNDAILLLGAMALSGEGVTLDVAGQISGMTINPARISNALRELEAAELVLRVAKDKLRPKHGIVNEVAIARIGAAERRALYGRAARVLTQHGQSPPSITAVQHDIAGDKLQAFDAALRAASASRDLHASREREYFLKLALSNAPTVKDQADIRIELAELFKDLGRPDDALDMLREESLDGTPATIRKRAQASRLAINLRKVDAATDINDAWQEVSELETSVDAEVVADLYYSVASAAHDLGRTQVTINAARKALAVSKRLSLSQAGARVAARSAMALALYVGFEEGLSAINALLRDHATSYEARAECLWSRGTLLIAAGRLLEAEEQFLQSIELMERCCLYGSVFGPRNNLGVCYIEQGRFGEASQQLEEATRVGKEFGGPSGAAIATDNFVMLNLERGDYRLALKSAREALDRASKRSARGLFFSYAIVGLCSLELGLLAQAFEAKREIEILFDQHEYWSNDMSYVEMFLARMLVLEDRVDEARERLATAIEVYRQRDVLCRARLELELGRIELKRDPAGALERATRMQETLRGTGARPLVDRFEELADRARHRGSA
jgi:tetratricopeptide (TPR) repeat protein